MLQESMIAGYLPLILVLTKLILTLLRNGKEILFSKKE